MKHTYSIFAVFVLILLGIVLYQPGLSGVFLFDDFINLEGLAALKQHNYLEAQIEFAFAGGASSLGRPLSLLTFALQANSWPSPFAFKLFNLILHICNNLLVLILAWQIGTLLKLSHTELKLFALLSALLWLAHPLQVSTVLYTIQRMTQLSAFFTLLGIILYLYGRLQVKHTPRLIIMSIGVIIGLGFGVLSKENAILLPIYLLAIEYTLLQTRPRHWQLWAAAFLYFPLILFAGWLIINFNSISQGYLLRDFSMFERLFTQPRILLDYAVQIILPRSTELNLFHDDVIISTSLLSPIQTLLSILFWTVAISAAFYIRKTLPILAFGVFWFIGGHLLEANIIPLMLYFEHRNYLPLLGFVFIISWLILKALQYLAKHSNLIQKTFYALIILYTISYPLVTYLENQLWGNPIQQAMLWAERKPHSLLAQAHAAQLMLDHQSPENALFYYQQMEKHRPEQIMPYVYQIQLSCTHPELVEFDFEIIKQRFQSAASRAGTEYVLNELLKTGLSKQCASLSFKEIKILFAALLENKNLTVFDQAFSYLLYAQLQAQAGDYFQALQLTEKALDFNVLGLHSHARNDLNAHLLRIQCWLALKDYQQANNELFIFQEKIGAQQQKYAALLKSLQTEINNNLKLH